jgi:hypothetical protein
MRLTHEKVLNWTASGACGCAASAASIQWISVCGPIWVTLDRPRLILTGNGHVESLITAAVCSLRGTLVASLVSFAAGVLAAAGRMRLPTCLDLSHDCYSSTSENYCLSVDLSLVVSSCPIYCLLLEVQKESQHSAGLTCCQKLEGVLDFKYEPSWFFKWGRVWGSTETSLLVELESSWQGSDFFAIALCVSF